MRPGSTRWPGTEALRSRHPLARSRREPPAAPGPSASGRDRWRATWQELFDTHRLVHNRRHIRRIQVTEEGDGALAVVDVDTLCRRDDGVENRWKDRLCKVYSRLDGAWKITRHTGVLEYPDRP